MKQVIILTLLTMVLLPVFSQEKIDFARFKTGKFTYETKKEQVEIIRTKKKQIEIFNNGMSKVILKIKWINDSTYVLSLKRAINAPGCLKKGDRVVTTILNASEDRYECFFTSKNCGEGRSVIIKLE